MSRKSAYRNISRANREKTFNKKMFSIIIVVVVILLSFKKCVFDNEQLLSNLIICELHFYGIHIFGNTKRRLCRNESDFYS